MLIHNMNTARTKVIMKFPTYYDKIAKIKLFDPLADILGSSEDGTFEFSFADAVRFAGHGCPTVGGAYLMTYFGLKALYQEEVPTRGMIEVQMNQAKDQGTTGVIASVVGSIVGASDEGGFKGLGGQFYRNNLIKFSQNFLGSLKLVRIDTREHIIMEYNPHLISGDPMTGILLEKILQNVATAEDKQMFSAIWNRRLEAIMVNEFFNPKLITAKK